MTPLRLVGSRLVVFACLVCVGLPGCAFLRGLLGQVPLDCQEPTRARLATDLMGPVANLLQEGAWDGGRLFDSIFRTAPEVICAVKRIAETARAHRQAGELTAEVDPIRLDLASRAEAWLTLHHQIPGRVR